MCSFSTWTLTQLKVSHTRSVQLEHSMARFLAWFFCVCCPHFLQHSASCMLVLRQNGASPVVLSA